MWNGAPGVAAGRRGFWAGAAMGRVNRGPYARPAGSGSLLGLPVFSPIGPLFLEARPMVAA